MVSALIAMGGAAKAYNDDVAEKKAKLAEIQAMTSKYMVETGLQKIADRREALAESKARVSLARNYGFSRRAAMAMEMSGQLAFELDKLEKLGPEKIAPNHVKDLTTFLETKIDNDEDLAAAIARGLQGESLKDDQELSVALINAMGDMNELQKQFLKTTETPDKPSVPRFQYQSTKGAAVTSSERGRIQSQLATSLGSLFDSSYSMTEENGVKMIVFDKPDVQRMFNTLTEKTVSMKEDPFSDYSVTSALNTIIGSIQGASNVQPDVVIDQIDNAIQYPNFNWNPYTGGNDNSDNNGGDNSVLPPEVSGAG